MEVLIETFIDFKKFLEKKKFQKSRNCSVSVAESERERWSEKGRVKREDDFDCQNRLQPKFIEPYLVDANTEYYFALPEKNFPKRLSAAKVIIQYRWWIKYDATHCDSIACLRGWLGKVGNRTNLDEMSSLDRKEQPAVKR